MTFTEIRRRSRRGVPEIAMKIYHLTCTFHCDLVSSGMASFASWFVNCIYCCKASCWLGDSCPVSSALSAIFGGETTGNRMDEEWDQDACVLSM